MENVEINVIQKFKDDAKMRGDKVLEFCNYGKVMFDIEGFDFTKVTNAKLILGGKIIPLEKISTWASLLRSVNEALKDWKNGAYEETFNSIIENVVDTYGLVMNHNFSMELFEDDSYINSNLYKNNKNHKLEVLDGKYICAVYSGEVVVVLNALVMAASVDGNNDKATLLVSYKKREDINAQDEDLSQKIYKFETMQKNIINLDKFIDKKDDNYIQILQVYNKIKYNQDDKAILEMSSEEELTAKDFLDMLTLITTNVYMMGSKILKFENEMFNELKCISKYVDILLNSALERRNDDE